MRRLRGRTATLAMMDHQNIARVLDAGTTDTGRPYFVMELVHGVPITQFYGNIEAIAAYNLKRGRSQESFFTTRDGEMITYSLMAASGFISPAIPRAFRRCAR